MSNYDYIVDIDNNRLLESFSSTEAASAGDLVYGDKPTVTARLVKTNSNDADNPWTQQNLTGQTIRVGVGHPAGKPKGGTYTLTFSGDTTTALAYDATPAEVSTALNLLDSVIAAGLVTVTDSAAGGLLIKFVTVGDKAEISADTGNLLPASSAFIASVAGGVSTYESQTIKFETDLAAYIELTDDIAAASIAITTLRAGVTNTTAEQQRFIISGDPWGGTYTITIAAEETASIPYDATPGEIETAIEALASITAGSVTVTGNSFDYTVEFASSLGDVGTATADVTRLLSPIGKTGTLDLHVTGIRDILGGEKEIPATLEIVRYTTAGDISETVLQAPCTVKEDVIPNSPPSATPLPNYLTEAEADVLYAPIGSSGGDMLAANNLSDVASAATSRTNLGVDAAGTDNSTDVTLGGTGTYISIAGQVITVDPITESDISDLGAYITGITGEPLSALSDVTITTIATGEVLQWDGSAWINRTLAEAGIQPALAEGAFQDGDKSQLDSTETSGELDIRDGANRDRSNHTGTQNLSTISDAGTVAGLDVPAVGDAAVGEVVKGSDTRLTDARTPTTHTHEGTAILSTGETVGKVLQADGDNSSSWVTLASGGDALVANPLSQFAATTSSQLLGVISDETGTGNLVFSTSPTLVTPDLGTPSALVATNATGTAAGLTVGATTGVEAGADVTDTTNVTAAGALMDSEVTNLAQVKAFDTTDYATAAQGTTADSAMQDLVDDTTPQLGGNLDAQGNDINNAGVAFLTEQANAEADVAGKGQIWTKTATPNRPMFTDDTGQDFELLETSIGFACSDETTALTTGQKIAFDMPYDFTVTRVYFTLTTAGTTSAITIDCEDEGTSILNAVLSISAAANNAETSTFASAATSYAFSKGDLFTVDVDSVDSGGTGAGLKGFLIGYRTS